jgi:hypothetical protein
MSFNEAERLSIMRQVDEKILNMRRASESLGVSLRQAKRIRKRYLSEGKLGLISKHRGKISPNRIDLRLKEASEHSAEGRIPRFWPYVCQ